MYVVDDWEVEREDVEMGAELGKGSFGMVYKGTFKDPKKVRIYAAGAKGVQWISCDCLIEHRLIFKATQFNSYNSTQLMQVRTQLTKDNTTSLDLDLFLLTFFMNKMYSNINREVPRCTVLSRQ